MPPRRVVRGLSARRNVKEQWVPNALEMQLQGEVTNAEFREAIRMLSQVATYQVGQRGSSVTGDPQNFIEEMKRLFNVMHVGDAERVELAAYQMKGVARIWFYKWKNNRDDDAPISRKEGKATILIGDIDLARFMIHVQQVEEDKLKDRAEFKNKRANTSGNEFKVKLAYSQGSMAQRGSKPPACTKCGRNHSDICLEGSTGCFKCDMVGKLLERSLQLRQDCANPSLYE
ncbi:uncharacterized protein LOC125877366 [Solanum stenotomum]|uniref:uncharacterized protein LOC125877366 n=1 Tax=Solanum stenotomum TaxID=172797 RepID=UPI0020D164C2|nr:uncharacterized protein LOC125877366 [Solanum stenotomum]